jgi:transaldolase
MTSRLEQLQQYTTLVADTGDIEAIRKFKPQDATTNPSLILKAAMQPEYEPLILEAKQWAEQQTSGDVITHMGDKLSVNIGVEILKLIPGRISTEIDARLSFDTPGSVQKAHKLIELYQAAGVPRHRVLIKLASTWEGIQAAKQLTQEGIDCNLTLLFSMAQAKACAESNVYLISPFVGRILDWHQQRTNSTFQAHNDPGVLSVKEIYQYYKKHQYSTVVMGASFRNIDEILELAGCDRLTISPQLLEQLDDSKQPLERKLSPDVNVIPRPQPMSEQAFRWALNQDPMATEKLAEGIRNFAQDQVKLEQLLQSKISTTAGI